MRWGRQHLTKGQQATKGAQREASQPIMEACKLTQYTSPTTTTNNNSMLATRNVEATVPQLPCHPSHTTRPPPTTLPHLRTALSTPVPHCSPQTPRAPRPPCPPTRSRLTPCKGVPAATSSKQQPTFLRDPGVKLSSRRGSSPWTGWPARTRKRQGPASGQISDRC